MSGLFAPLVQGLPPQHEGDSGRLTVVLDMDETLIHAEVVAGVPDTKDDEGEGDTFYLPFGPTGWIRVTKRPFLHQFLLGASERFELIVFTAGMEEYADAILNRIDPLGTLFRHRLYRQHCTTMANGGMAKDLSILNRDLQRTVLVDNCPISFTLPQLENGVLIPSFVDDPLDSALMKLAELLTVLTPVRDVRQHLAKVFQLRRLIYLTPHADEV